MIYKLAADLIDEWHITVPIKSNEYYYTDEDITASIDKNIIFKNCSKLKSITKLDDKHQVLIYSR